MAAEGAAGLTKPVADVNALQRRASDLAREAEVITRRYDRWIWVRYVALWVPIPLFVLTFRYHLDAWHYYVLGALFVAAAATIYAIEMRALARRDRAIEAADAARVAYYDALREARA